MTSCGRRRSRMTSSRRRRSATCRKARSSTSRSPAATRFLPSPRRSAGSRTATTANSSSPSWRRCCPRATTPFPCGRTSSGRAVSELAFSFGRIAAEYDDVRPDYDPEALRRAEEVLGLSAHSACVVDLAAGSGKLTRPLARRFREVVAVEPNDAMRAVLAGRSAGIKVVAGTAERMPLPDDFADAVFVGDAFHWFDGPAAVAELERVLRPHGGVALLWNHWWSDGDDRMVDTLEPPLPAEAQARFDEVYFSSGRAAARAELAAPLEAFAGGSFA